jgi:hypothetical protein
MEGAMPETAKGTKIREAMQEEYGTAKGKEVFYASKNAGTISGVDQSPPPVIPTVTGTDPSGMSSGINRPMTQAPGPTTGQVGTLRDLAAAAGARRK